MRVGGRDPLPHGEHRAEAFSWQQFETAILPPGTRYTGRSALWTGSLTGRSTAA